MGKIDTGKVKPKGSKILCATERITRLVKIFGYEFSINPGLIKIVLQALLNIKPNKRTANRNGQHFKPKTTRLCRKTWISSLTNHKNRKKSRSFLTISICKNALRIEYQQLPQYHFLENEAKL